MTPTYEPTSKRFPLTAIQIEIHTYQEVNPLLFVDTPTHLIRIPELGVFSQPTLWELIISPVSSSCSVVPYLPISAFSQVWCPHLFTNIGPLHVRTAGTAFLTAATASPAFILALGGRRAFTFGPFECWVCGPDTSKCRGPNWAK